MRKPWLACIIFSSLFCCAVYADARESDEILANAALRELHNLAAASVKSMHAADDRDYVGCRNATENMEEAAHAALEYMHSISFAPMDAIHYVSTLLRLKHIAQPDGCSSATDDNLQPLTAGQAIMALRWDYAIGDDNWYVVEASGDIIGKNPLRYAQSLKDMDYSWVDTRPKDMVAMVESDWKSEMSSDRVDDSSIENSGSNVQAVEVGYRKSPSDELTLIYFYRTKDGAMAAQKDGSLKAEREGRKRAEDDAAESDWEKKLVVLPFLVANSDAGFKLIYGLCKPAGNDSNGIVICSNYESLDWSDDPNLPYRWFGEIQECKDALDRFVQSHPETANQNSDGFFISDCVPAPKVTEATLTGYQMLVAISSPVDGSKLSYENLRQNGSESAMLFKSFDACYKKESDVYSKIQKFLNVDANGRFLNDKTKSIGVMAYCVRVY